MAQAMREVAMGMTRVMCQRLVLKAVPARVMAWAMSCWGNKLPEWWGWEAKIAQV